MTLNVEAEAKTLKLRPQCLEAEDKAKAKARSSRQRPKFWPWNQSGLQTFTSLQRAAIAISDTRWWWHCSDSLLFTVTQCFLLPPCCCLSAGWLSISMTDFCFNHGAWARMATVSADTWGCGTVDCAFFYWKKDFVRGIGVCVGYKYMRGVCVKIPYLVVISYS